MTRQESLWAGKYVWVTGILSKSGRLHYNLRKYVGRGGFVHGEAKNGMLLVEFGGMGVKPHRRAIPAGCLALYGEVHRARRQQG